MLPLDTGYSEVKVWVPSGCLPKNECHFYQSTKANINSSPSLHLLVMET